MVSPLLTQVLSQWHVVVWNLAALYWVGLVRIYNTNQQTHKTKQYFVFYLAGPSELLHCGLVKGHLLLLRLAPLRVHSATGCQRAQEWLVLGQVDCVGPWQPVGVKVVLHHLHPGHPQSSFQYTEGEEVKICFASTLLSIRAICLNGVRLATDLHPSNVGSTPTGTDMFSLVAAGRAAGQIVPMHQ